MVAFLAANDTSNNNARRGVVDASTIDRLADAVIAGANANTAAGQTAGVTGGVVAGTLGATLLSNSFQTSKEAEIHREALAELGQSIDIDLAPRVIAFNAVRSTRGDAVRGGPRPRWET